MATYRYRLKFLVHSAGAISHDSNISTLTFKNGSSPKLRALDADTIGKGTIFELTEGGYSTELEARNSGEIARSALMYISAKFGIGIDAGKDNRLLWINPEIKNEFLQRTGVRTVEDVHGICVFDEQYPVSISTCTQPRISRTCKIEDINHQIALFISVRGNLDEKEKLALELYGASFFERSERTRFLTLILGVESLLILEERKDRERSHVDFLINETCKADIDPEQKKSMIGSLRWLYQYSISQSLKYASEKHLGGKYYDGMPASKFIGKCYEARSKLVHKGNVEKVDLGRLAANLEVYLADLLISIVGVVST